MTMVMDSAKYMSTRWKDSGHCFGPGYVLIVAFRRKNCRSISRSSSSFTTLENEGKHSSIRSLSDFWSDLPGTPDEPNFIRLRKVHRLTGVSMNLVSISGDAYGFMLAVSPKHVAIPDRKN